VGIKVSDADMGALNIKGDTFHPDWDYTISPRAPPWSGNSWAMPYRNVMRFYTGDRRGWPGGRARHTVHL